MKNEKLNWKREWALSMLDNAAFWDGFDSAIIGVAQRCGEEGLVVYDREAMISVLMKCGNREDAEEYLQHNVAGAWIGPLTPMIIERVPPKARFIASVTTVQELTDEVQRLRDALTRITENRDEPYSADFAKDILERRNP